jgi:hypothetical protein
MKMGDSASPTTRESASHVAFVNASPPPPQTRAAFDDGTTCNARGVNLGAFHTSERRGGVERREMELKGVAGGD